MPDPTTRRIDTTIDGIADVARSIREEVASLDELLGRLVEGVMQARDAMDALRAENDALREALGSLAPDTTNKENDR